MKERMKTVQYLLLALALFSLQISYSESRQNERRRDRTGRRRYSIVKLNICEVTSKESKVHCYCENTESKKATRADCWVFNGGIKPNDTIWTTFDLQPYLKSLAFNVRSTGELLFVPLQMIHRLKHLQKLRINYATLPEIENNTFSNLTTLRELTLNDNKIVKLDFSSFINLPSLVNLTIKENNISEIQRDVFVDLPSLKRLDLSSNHIDLVHDGAFEHLTFLDNLVLETNSITVLTRDTFSGLANLTRLDLRSNKVTMIGDLTFAELTNLNELLLDNNKLRYLSVRAFDGLSLLQKLSMTGNQLKSINEGLLEGVPGLELLDLRNNEIEHFTYETIKPILENLKMKTSVLYLSGNKLTCDCQLSWIQVLQNETKSEPLQLALEDVTCIPVDKAVNPTASKSEQVYEIEAYDDANEEIKYEPTVEPVIASQTPVVEMLLESLQCRNELIQNNEDTLMLSSKEGSSWKASSSNQLMKVALVIILFLTAI